MPFVKLVKNKAYFKRFQTKYRRRREGKTDYYARKRLVVQAKNKYNSPKYRMVVRFTNKDIITQIVYSKIDGDYVLAAAYAHELPRYGINNGLTNWPAAYCTGLLLARRVLTKLGLAEKYEGCTEPDGEKFEVEYDDEGPRPFKAFLDVGLKRTTTGSRIFGALKGAVDGGLSIPYSEKRFPGYDASEKKHDAELLASYIYGGHISEYMEYLMEEDDEAYKKQFASYIAAGIEPDGVEDYYKEAHEKIREDPVAQPKGRQQLSGEALAKAKSYKATRLTYAERQARVEAKKAELGFN
ncbi:60S ribosomal protein L5 [Kappamyces sp. JEL0829]|nr:60S ribosomal protein L5 [Kappamyces sp. JEL0829]